VINSNPPPPLPSFTVGLGGRSWIAADGFFVGFLDIECRTFFADAKKQNIGQAENKEKIEEKRVVQILPR
jgi:hypothetical protein